MAIELKRDSFVPVSAGTRPDVAYGSIGQLSGAVFDCTDGCSPASAISHSRGERSEIENGQHAVALEIRVVFDDFLGRHARGEQL